MNVTHLSHRPKCRQHVLAFLHFQLPFVHSGRNDLFGDLAIAADLGSSGLRPMLGDAGLALLSARVL